MERSRELLGQVFDVQDLIIGWIGAIVISALIILFLVVVVIHALGLIGIGKGTPWTITHDDRKKRR